MIIDPFKRTLLSLRLHTLIASLAGLFLLVVIPLLSSCSTTAQDATGVNNRFSNGNHRQIPDVSAPAYALAVYSDGQWGAVGGTSAAAPIGAAGLALVNQGLMKQSGKFTASPQLFYIVAQNTNGMQP